MNSPAQPDRRAAATWPRPRAGAARAACRCCRTSATPSSAGRPGRRRSCAQGIARRARAALAVQAGQLRRRPDRLLRRRRRAGALPARGAQARRADAARTGAGRPRSWRCPTTSTSRRSASATWRRMQRLVEVLAALGHPRRAAGRRVLPVGRGAGRRRLGRAPGCWPSRPASSCSPGEFYGRLGRLPAGGGGPAGRSDRARRPPGRAPDAHSHRGCRCGNAADELRPYDLENGRPVRRLPPRPGVGRDDRRTDPPGAVPSRCSTRSASRHPGAAAAAPTPSPVPTSIRASRSTSAVRSGRSRSTSCRGLSTTPPGRSSSRACVSGSRRWRHSWPTSTGRPERSRTASYRAASSRPPSTSTGRSTASSRRMACAYTSPAST